MSIAILRGDAAHLPLPDQCVDLVVTSPPYFSLRDYRDGGESLDGQIGSEATPREYLDALIGCTAEWVRVLKPSGSIFVNLGDKFGRGTRTTSTGQSNVRTGSVPLRITPTGSEKSLIGLPWRYAIRCMDDLGLILRRDIIWAKPNGLPESVTDRCRSSHEYVFHLVKQPRYFSAVDEIRETYAPETARRYAAGYNPRALDGKRLGIGTSLGGDTYDKNPLGKLPGSVWGIASQPLTVPPHLGVDHFAAFPMELPRRIIAGWSPPGGIVADPFGGTGTTALVADALGRHGISADMSADYCRLARWRTADPGERARAMQVPKPPAVPDGQPSLFDLEAS